ncbi:MAG: permease [Thermodesulfobacteriota bacterium]
MALKFRQRMAKFFQTAWDFFLQLNYYLVLAVLIAGAIKVLLPTDFVVSLVGGKNLNSVLIASAVALLAYVCTYVEIPTALALISKGMGGGATLAYLLGGPGLSLPSIVMLSGVFKPKVLSLYVGVSFLGCVIAGYLFNIF